MNEQSMTQLLLELDAALSNSESLSPHDRELLEHLLLDVQELLASSKKPAPGDTALVDRLRDATGRFEVSHPDLTAGIARIIDSLSNMGI